MSQEYKTPKIEKLLEEFSIDELRTLCTEKFELQLSPNQLPDTPCEAARKIIEHAAEENSRVEILLEWAKEKKRDKYEQHGPYLKLSLLEKVRHLIKPSIEKINGFLAQFATKPHLIGLVAIIGVIGILFQTFDIKIPIFPTPTPTPTPTSTPTPIPEVSEIETYMDGVKLDPHNLPTLVAGKIVLFEAKVIDTTGKVHEGESLICSWSFPYSGTGTPPIETDRCQTRHTPPLKTTPIYIIQVDVKDTKQQFQQGDPVTLNFNITN